MTDDAVSAGVARPAMGSSSVTSRYGSLFASSPGSRSATGSPLPSRPSARWRRRASTLPVAVLIWLMIIPMLVKIDFGALRQVSEHWRGIGVTLFINWAVKPFSMALLAWLFKPARYVLVAENQIPALDGTDVIERGVANHGVAGHQRGGPPSAYRRPRALAHLRAPGARR